MPFEEILIEIWSLAREFDSLAKRLDESPSPEERKRLRQRMKVVVEQMDRLISSRS